MGMPDGLNVFLRDGSYATQGQSGLMRSVYVL